MTADVCKAVNIALDLSPAPISLTLEPCDYAGKRSDSGAQYRDPVLITAHDPATLRTRQVGIHSQALYQRPSVWAAVASGIGLSPILNLTIPWDCMDALVKQLQPVNIGLVERLTIRVTSDAGTLDMWRARSLAPPSDWPVFPALRHLTVMQDSDMHLLDPDLVRDAIQKLVPLPRQLDTLSLHHVRTGWPGWTGVNAWHSLLDAAAKVYGISS
ncbi:hypothetical protein EXIGLDRAFT_759423 [Exidia glandulosa HHB12029]|uniref:Uncharacterized protein n=1 Tax=Exidia glandulosa HHB12029 TaxID=1314781 RepID=A0A165Q5M3_EXIGL|nr:hypothetical protein EXIGLDRAFT_759423 [Exidia glandulosa HHB12029]